MGQWTFDNAGNNNTAMEKIQRCCAADGIMFDALGNRNRLEFLSLLYPKICKRNILLRCFPHVINISAQTVTKELKENPTHVWSSAYRVDMAIEELDALAAYDTAIKADPVGKARTMVSMCRSSGQRCADLREIIVAGCEQRVWALRPVQLLRDVETRWSSLRCMVGRVIELYPVSNIRVGCPSICHSPIS